jgi:dienelactone hydrolase
MDRKPTFGFRTVKTIDIGSSTGDRRELEPIAQIVRDVSHETPVNDEQFRFFSRLYDYDRIGLAPKVESSLVATKWKKESVSYAAAYNNERIPAYLFLPLNAKPPYQVVIYYPGAYAAVIPSSRDDAAFEPQYFDFIISSGRAVLLPVFKGLYERRVGPLSPAALRDLSIQIFKDEARSLDYLESRSDIDTTRLAYYGNSLGSNGAPIRLALEHRFKAAVLVAAGLLPSPALPEVEVLNFLPRVTLPTLIVNGRQDFMRPYESSQVPFFERLGTSQSDKRFAVYDGPHVPPRVAMIKEILDWLDKYLGPVSTSATN